MRAFILALLLAVTACGGDYDGERPLAQNYPGGLYEGIVLESDSSQPLVEDFAQAIITQDGYAAVGSLGFTIVGRLTMQGEHFDEFLKVYAWNGNAFPDGATVKPARFVGNIENGDASYGDRLEGFLFLDHKGNFIEVQDADALYELEVYLDSVRDSSNSFYTGTYTDGITTLTFSSDGSFTGQDTNGCAFNGQISIPDPDFNAARLRSAAGTCGGIQGEMEGNIARLQDADTGIWYLWAIGRYGSTGFNYVLEQQ